MDTPVVTEPSLGRALGAIADTAIDQVHELVAARLDHWAGLLHERLAAPAAPSAPARDLHPVIIGALAGATLGWLLARWHRGS